MMGGSSAASTYTPDDDDAKTEQAGGMFVTSSGYTTEEKEYTLVLYVTVTAGTNKTAYTITFDNNDGSKQTTNVSFTTDTAATFVESTREVAGNYSTPTRTGGYVFAGWQLGEGPQAKTITATADKTIAEALTEALATVKTDTTLKAVWTAPDVYVENGVWIINGVNTGIQVEGQDGAEGVGIKEITSALSEDGTKTVVTITLTNNSTYTVEIPSGANGANGTNGAQGAVGATGATGAAGEDAGAGLSVASLIVGIIAIVVALGAAGVVVVLLLKKKNA
jgi:hypothetical protein